MNARSRSEFGQESMDCPPEPSARFHFQWGANELLMREHSKQVMIDLFKAMGGELWRADDQPDRRGTSLHETGVCRFGSDPKTSVTNKWAQAHDVPNLYICDDSIFPSRTDKTTTMPSSPSPCARAITG
jgi:choline dehydrogenase-like flavoprotein